MHKFEIIGNQKSTISDDVEEKFLKSGERFNFLGKNHSHKKEKRNLAWKVAPDLFASFKYAWGGIVYALLQIFVLWTSWVCPPPTRPWEGLSNSISPKGFQDCFWTIIQLLVFRMWAVQLRKHPKGSLRKPSRTTPEDTVTEGETNARLLSNEPV